MRQVTSIFTLSVLLLSLAFSGRMATRVSAEGPSNDEISGAIWLGLPDSHATSTIEATQGAGENYCSSGPSVWYAFSGTGSWINANTIGSNFDTVLTVLVDHGGGLEYVTCNDDGYGAQSRVKFFAEPGATYFFLVQGYGGQTGSLSISTAAADPPFSFELSIDQPLTVNARTGVVTVRGTVTCSVQGYAYVSIEVRQRAGRAWIQGNGNTWQFTCDENVPTAWAVQIQGANGIFKAGPATMSGVASGYDPVWFEYDHEIIGPTNHQIVGSR